MVNFFWQGCPPPRPTTPFKVREPQETADLKLLNSCGYCRFSGLHLSRGDPVTQKQASQPPHSCSQPGGRGQARHHSVVPQDAVTVALHIRRGDVMGYGVAHHQVKTRMFLNAAYVGLLDRLLPLLRRVVGAGRPLRVLFNCQGARPPALVPDANGTLTDFGPLLAAHGAAAAIGSSDAVAAFHEMCTADVLVAARSGMSHLVTVLCTRPAVLAPPVWSPLNCVPNVVPARLAYREIAWGAHRVNITSAVLFNETAFEGLVRARVLHNRTLRCCPTADAAVFRRGRGAGAMMLRSRAPPLRPSQRRRADPPS